MLAWTCSTDSASCDNHAHVWAEAMQHISLPRPNLRDQSGFQGNVFSITSPLGIEFSRVEASAQTLSGSCFSKVPCLWLALPIEGEFNLGAGGRNGQLRAGEILYGPTGCNSTLDLNNHFVMFYIRVPQTMLHPRLLNLRTLAPGTLAATTAVNRMLSGLLRSIADNLDELKEADIRPVEIAVSEFIISNLAESDGSGFPDGEDVVTFNRIRQAIERQLGNGDISLQAIADQLAVSPASVQKLFQMASLSFGQYLRKRRLQHCYADLANATLRKLSISDISFRWGFNDAAHFSRSFRSDYGMTPRAFRRQQLDRLGSKH